MSLNKLVECADTVCLDKSAHSSTQQHDAIIHNDIAL